MKIRKGFVSNSSSSSFIVAFPKDIELTEEAIHEYLYGKTPGFIDAYGDRVPTTQAAEIICREMKEQTPNSMEALEEAAGGWINGAPNMDEFRIPESGKREHQLGIDWEAYNAARDKFKKSFIKSFTDKYGVDKDLYTFEFSDNDGSLWSTMEHGNTFDNVPHERISNH